MLKHSAQLGVNVTVTAVNIIRKQNNRWGKEFNNKLEIRNW